MRTHRLEATTVVTPILAEAANAVAALGHGNAAALYAKNDANSALHPPGVVGESKDGPGVFGNSNFDAGVSGDGLTAGVRGRGSQTGVWGLSQNEHDSGVKGEGVTGVWGLTSANHFAGVYGEHTGTSGYGTIGVGKGDDAGVAGRNFDKDGLGVHGVAHDTQGLAGVKGEGITGVWGLTRTDSHSGVYGEHKGTSGYGTVGIGKGPLGAGVLGRNEEGYGGQFEGKRAQLMLKPGRSAGKPTTGKHQRGEIYMDSAGTLFVCVAKGTPGTWKEIATTPEDTTTTEETPV
jgi:hypothetical protein